MFENFTLDNLEMSNYFGENIGIIDQNYSEESVEFLGSEFYGKFYACELLLQKDGNNDILPVYINKDGLILNFYGNIVTYVGEVINLDGSEYQKLYIKNIENFLANEKEIYVSINKSNFSFNLFTINIEDEEYVTFNEINIEKEIENNGYYSTGSNILENNNNYIQHIGNKEYTFKGFYENKKFRKISFNGARKNNFFVDIYEGLYLDTNISIYDLVNIGYKAGSLIDRIVRYDGYNLQVGNLGYSYYQVIDPEKKINNRAIYNYEEDKYITDFEFQFIISIKDKNARIIVGQEKKSWNFKTETFYGVYDLNERKLIKSCRYSMKEMEEYIKNQPLVKVFNVIEKNLDSDLQQAIILAERYEYQKKLAEQKQKEFLEKEKLIKEEEKKVKELKNNIVEEMNKEYYELEENMLELANNKKELEEKYGMNIVDILKSVEEYK